MDNDQEATGRGVVCYPLPMVGSRPESVLVIRLSSLGDIARLLPALRALKASGLSRVDLTVEDRFLLLAELFPIADRVIPYPRRSVGSPIRHPAGWVKAFTGYIERLRKEHYDLALDLHGILRSALVLSLCGAKETAGYGPGFGREFCHLFYEKTLNPAPSTKISRYERYAGALIASGFPPPSPAYFHPRIPLDARDHVSAFLEEEGLKTGEYIFAFIGASKAQAAKRWPLFRFAELARMAWARLGLPTVVAWGPEESESATSLRKEAYLHPAPVWKLPSLLEAISGARAFVGADTGPTHLAALMGIPVVALFGMTDPVVNRPFGNRLRIVAKGRIDRPCRGEDCPHDRCMGALAADEVFKALSLLLEKP